VTYRHGADLNARRHHAVVKETKMTEKPDTGLTAEWVRALAQARGLDRAYALYPEAVAAAVARGTGSLSPLPADFSAVTEPAVAFDPAKFGGSA
jgi:hypothetical protein